MDAAVAAMPACCRSADGRRVPTLLLVGGQDMIVPGRASRGAVQRLTADAPVRLGVYREGFHLLLADRNRDAVARDVVSFVTAPTAPLPSGADSDAAAWLEDAVLVVLAGLSPLVERAQALIDDAATADTTNHLRGTTLAVVAALEEGVKLARAADVVAARAQDTLDDRDPWAGPLKGAPARGG